MTKERRRFVVYENVRGVAKVAVSMDGVNFTDVRGKAVDLLTAADGRSPVKTLGFGRQHSHDVYHAIFRTLEKSRTAQVELRFWLQKQGSAVNPEIVATYEKRTGEKLLVPELFKDAWIVQATPEIDFCPIDTILLTVIKPYFGDSGRACLMPWVERHGIKISLKGTTLLKCATLLELLSEEKVAASLAKGCSGPLTLSVQEPLAWLALQSAFLSEKF